MDTLKLAARRALGLVLLLAGVALTASACVFVPVDGPGYAAAPPPRVYAAPPAVIVAPRVAAPRYGWYRHRYYW